MWASAFLPLQRWLTESKRRFLDKKIFLSSIHLQHLTFFVCRGSALSKLINPGKFPLEGLPSLIKDMEDNLPKILGKEFGGEGEGTLEAPRTSYQEALTAAKELSAIATALTQKLRPLNLDHDAAGYALFNQLTTNIEALQARAVSLELEEANLLATCQDLKTTIFTEGTDIFKLSHSAEWDAVERLITRAKTPDIQNKLQALGLGIMYRRLVRCHDMMGVALGKKSGSSNPADSTLSNFEKAIARLIVKAYAFYDQESAEHEAKRKLLVGSYEYQLEFQREKARTQQTTK
jgi:hypothetical protein